MTLETEIVSRIEPAAQFVVRGIVSFGMFMRSLIANPMISFRWDGMVVMNVCLALFVLRFALAGAINYPHSPSVFGALAKLVAKPNKKLKFAENLWYSCWHISAFCVSFPLLTSQEWFLQASLERNKDVFFPNLDSREQWMTPQIKLLSLVFLGFWFSFLLFLKLEMIRKDFLVMVIHHLATIYLVGHSYLLNYWRVGLAVHLCHDFADMFLQLVAFPWLCIYPCFVHVFGEGGQLAERRVSAGILTVLLCVLLCLHIYWWFQIMRIIKSTIQNSTVTAKGDERSEIGDDDELEKEREELLQGREKDKRKRQRR
uniref:TLC domain-containing protein n=1 Tax=Chromera velia CCMP2878 TaxID=1169474 RepID=A0A0G4EYR4_9ALVE|eukprot:Cvel_14208.t1-p1 / transcript=Cvel_14208.t1 / gene=Cvel_14208 / organism=Chromera_velia_CCMP2878 / gene_product=hypothetical protein / transcript_product=hypothetical protein / location=Cvel_scaffold1002:333-3267(+) / protein_length=313 / sequence_SO=supercontig / SO=protein_coding / is_pseudo=false